MKRYCRNCFHPLPSKAKFCSQCGQKDSDGKVRMSTMVRKLWDTTFHLEGKFLRSCWQLFIPGKVTLEFFKGKQDRYPHPLRMFAIVMFLFLFMVNTLLNDRHKSRTNNLVNVTGWEQDTTDNTSSRRNGMSLYEQLKYKTLLQDIRTDFEKLPKEWQTKESRMVVDSLLRNSNLRHKLDQPGLIDSLDASKDTSNITFWGTQELRIATLDIVRYSPDEIIERYNITDWRYQLMLRQTIKSFKSPDALVHTMVGSLTWAILALITLMSGVLSLLYWRQKRYYVEHFIFLLHYHTGLMLAFLLGLIGLKCTLWSTWFIVWLLLAGALFFYWAMRHYYGQVRWKTIVKWLVFGVVYWVMFALLFVLGVLVVFAVF